MVCSLKGYKCRIVSNDAVAQEKLRTMSIFGAQLELEKVRKDGWKRRGVEWDEENNGHKDMGTEEDGEEEKAFTLGRTEELGKRKES
jgi:cysteine synthase